MRPPALVPLSELGKRIALDRHRQVRLLLADLRARINRLGATSDKPDVASGRRTLREDFRHFDAGLRLHLRREAGDFNRVLRRRGSVDVRSELTESIAAAREAHAAAEESLSALITQVQAVVRRCDRRQVQWHRLLMSMRHLELELQEEIHLEQGNFFPRLLAVTRAS